MTDLRRAVAIHRELVERIKAAFPAQTEESLADTIEGETQLDAAILATIRAALEREAMAEALGRMVEQMRARKDRLASGAETLRKAAKHAMTESGLTKLSAPDLTASVGNGPAKVVVTDEAALPEAYVRIKREPDKRAIGNALKDGHPVPGASLSNPEMQLTVRRS